MNWPATESTIAFSIFDGDGETDSSDASSTDSRRRLFHDNDSDATDDGGQAPYHWYLSYRDEQQVWAR